ncbi:MAG: histidine kinase [Cyclobacteriaceae bacterium]|nr:histidine kinase [Cyclobacteriaceae bacterium]
MAKSTSNWLKAVNPAPGNSLFPYFVFVNGFERSLDRVVTRQRWLLHVLFWVFVLIFYAVFFGRKNSNYLLTGFLVVLLLPVTAATMYFMNYFLVPRYLLKANYGKFLLYFVYTLTFSLFLEMIVAFMVFLLLAEVKIKDMSPASVDFVFMLTSLLLVVFMGMGIKMLLHWRRSREDYERLLREKVEAELKFLKAQLNPHFLFNTLNNLYYLTIQKSDKAPQAILQLSEILDYVMRSGKLVFVPLTEELKQVNNYISLEQLRYEDRVEIRQTLLGNPGDLTIGPMMFVSLIENAFKHGVLNSPGQTWIEIKTLCDPSQVAFEISNPVNGPTLSEGIGLDNLRNQLNYLYPNDHRLSIENADNKFSVKLTVTQKK